MNMVNYFTILLCDLQLEDNLIINCVVLGGFVTKDMSEATHIVLADINLFISTYPSYTRKHRQYMVHVQVCINQSNKEI